MFFKMDEPNEFFKKEKERAHVGVKYNDKEYDLLKDRPPMEGESLIDLVDKEEKAKSKLLKPLEEFVKEYFEDKHSIMLGSKEYDVVLGVPKKEASKFVTDAETKFPTYSFHLTIDPKENIGNMEVVGPYP